MGNLEFFCKLCGDPTKGNGEDPAKGRGELLLPSSFMKKFGGGCDKFGEKLAVAGLPFKDFCNGGGGVLPTGGVTAGDCKQLCGLSFAYSNLGGSALSSPAVYNAFTKGSYRKYVKVGGESGRRYTG